MVLMKTSHGQADVIDHAGTLDFDRQNPWDRGREPNCLWFFAK